MPPLPPLPYPKRRATRFLAMTRLGFTLDWEGPASNLSGEVVYGRITAKALCAQNRVASLIHMSGEAGVGT